MPIHISRRVPGLAMIASAVGSVALLASFLPLNAQALSDASYWYQVADLGTLGGTTSIANYINNPGQIVGTSRAPNGSQHAFLYADGSMQDLGTFGGSESAGNIINDRGAVGGAANFANGSRHGFLYEDGLLHDLGALPGSAVSGVFGLNNRGQVLGGSTLPGTTLFHAVAFGDDGVVDLGTLGGPSSFGVRVNDVGAATGRADVVTGLSHAFLYRDGAMFDVGVLPGDSVSFGRDLNNRGEVAAQSCNANTCRGFLWRDGVIRELGSLGGSQTNPFSINDRGQVVGGSRTATSGTATRAFLWEDGVIVDLNDYIEQDTGWVLLQANCINASGQIVGNGTLNGEARAFLLTPQPRRLRYGSR